MSKNSFTNEFLKEIPLHKGKEEIFKEIQSSEQNSNTSKQAIHENTQQRNYEQEIRRTEIFLADKAQNIDLRKRFSNWAITLLSSWLIFVAIIILIQHDVGWNITLFDSKFGFSLKVQQKLNDAVLIALLSTTTANLIGIPLVILKSLFPEMKAKRPPIKSSPELIS